MMENIRLISKIINPPQKQSYFTLNPDSLVDLYYGDILQKVQISSNDK